MDASSCENRHFFPLTALQIGDLQSYLSDLCLFLAPYSKKLFILVDNRPWLINQDLRTAHLWQYMVTKSRLSPFANTKLKDKREMLKTIELQSGPNFDPKIHKNLYKWFSIIGAALQQKKTFPVKRLKDSLMWNSELHHTLYGFIVFEVSWVHVRGINYLNELQTDTSMSLESKLMKRWEFESVKQASKCILSWFSGTLYEYFLLQDYLNDLSVTDEVFYDAQDDPMSVVNLGGDVAFSHDDNLGESSSIDGLGNFEPFPGHAECELKGPWMPHLHSGSYKRRKLMKGLSLISDFDLVSEKEHVEMSLFPRHSRAFISTSSIGDDNVSASFEATHYMDVLISFRFNDRDLPFRLKQIITCDMRLLRLLEAGLPSWVIFLQSYPLFCHIYRPWMCPFARALYVLISVITVLIGFYDLYKNVPLLKATAARLCGPLFNWIESWEMISRIKYLGTMLFLQNFEKAIKWSLMMMRYIRSSILVFTEPIAQPLAEFLGYFLPLWDVCLQIGACFSSFIGLAIRSTHSVGVNLVEVIVWPLWCLLYGIWRIVTIFIYPLICTAYEIIISPIRLVLASANLIFWLFSSIFCFLRDSWSSVSSIFQIASTSESAEIEVPIWFTLWNDLFSQIFRAIRSIIYGFAAFFATCNRHRLSIYNHMQEFILRLSFFLHNSPFDHFLARIVHGHYYQPSTSPHWTIRPCNERCRESIPRGGVAINGFCLD